MILKNLVTFVATATLLTGAMLSAPVMAKSDNGFSALQGVEAQALSSQEMSAISGELNALEIAAALNAKAIALLEKLPDVPEVAAVVAKLADFFTDNAAKIDAIFMKLGVFTPFTP